MTKSKYVVTITRQFGSLGRPIAKRMSEILDIGYYDRDLVDEAAKKLKLPVSVVDKEEESAKKVPLNPFTRMKYPLEKAPAIPRTLSLRHSRILYTSWRKRRPASSWAAARISSWKR